MSNAWCLLSRDSHAHSCFGIESNRLLTEIEFIFLQQIRLLCLLIEEKSALQTANK
jgi:hypothetical protein